MRYIYSLVTVILLLLISSCATYNAQYNKNANQTEAPAKDITHTFYLIGDAGNSDLGESSKALQNFKVELKKASKT